MFFKHTYKDKVFASKLLLFSKEIKFTKQEFFINKLISGIKYF